MSSSGDEPQGEASIAFTPRPGLERTLVFIVVLLGLMILAGLSAVVLRIIYLSSQPRVQLVGPPSAELLGPPSAGLSVPSPTELSGPSPTELGKSKGGAVLPSVSGGTTEAQVLNGLALPMGAVVRNVALDGDRLAVQYDAAGASSIVVYDFKAGRVVARVPVLVESARAAP